ncbi:GATA zinc finger domain-containing protein 14-like [Teleopsis dalmanni]|uniref:GATA zinc finger domain-containing protein 14-like n=1 Tax=Teleopsis dalmanni TaxID=139649 RepID=UPI0018CFD4E3|nr:GATA zinc finger domain-containing protein 14-like [Teleopsis dalmanni]
MGNIYFKAIFINLLKVKRQLFYVNMKINSNVTNNSTLKMGSRRIFTPQFKLQVLESYRNDIDCKGNQRATARKYNIHRRQIQKWLQCESILRSSVANTAQVSIKQSFNNKNQINMGSTSASFCPSFVDDKQFTARSTLNENEVSNIYTNASNVPIINTNEILRNKSVRDNSVKKSNLLLNSQSLSSRSNVSLIRPIAMGIPTRNNSLLSIDLHCTQPDHRYMLPYTLPTLHCQQKYTSLPPHDQSVMYATIHNKILENQSIENMSIKTITNEKSELRHTQECTGTKLFAEKHQNACSKNLYNFNGNLCTFENKQQYFEITNDSSIITTTPIDLSLGIRNKNNESNQIISKNCYNYLDQKQLTLYCSENLTKNNSNTHKTFNEQQHNFINEVVSNDQKQKPEELYNKTTTVFSRSIKQTKENFENSFKSEKKVDVTSNRIISKPVKLFKPYLLEDENTNGNEKTLRVDNSERNDNQETIIWNKLPNNTSLRLNNCDKYQREDETNFSCFNKNSLQLEKEILFKKRSTGFQSEFCSSLSTGLYPNLCQYPKEFFGSGYESCSSTYSDSSCRSESCLLSNDRTYSIDIEMQTFYDNVRSNQIHLQDWLNQGSNINASTTPNTSIALYA